MLIFLVFWRGSIVRSSAILTEVLRGFSQSVIHIPGQDFETHHHIMHNLPHVSFFAPPSLFLRLLTLAP
jgi:hypothetical protein